MKKNLIYALVIITLAILVMLFNTDRETVDLLVTEVRVMQAITYLCFMGLGVAVGLLLR